MDIFKYFNNFSTDFYLFPTALRLPQTYMLRKAYAKNNSFPLSSVVHGHMPHVNGGNTQRGCWYLQCIQPLTLKKTFIISHLFLKIYCIRNTTSESPLIASHFPFSVCTKVNQISSTTSTTFHWISWNILRHLLCRYFVLSLYFGKHQKHFQYRWVGNK